GLLRRGLAVEWADAALITNVAADHLGEYGINTVAELTEAKFIVHRALDEHSPLILNADDAGVVNYEQGLRKQRPGTSWWFSLDAANPRLQSAMEQGATVCFLRDGALWLVTGEERTPRRLAGVAEVSASHGGLLRHNLQNAMGAVLVAMAMGVSESALKQGLQDFRGDEQDNPGRGNWFAHAGIRIVVDFAHNAHGLRALGDAVTALQPGRVILMTGQAGDRDDEAIRELTRAALCMHPDVLLINQLPGYERGRPIDVPPAVIRAEALANGMLPEQLEIMQDPLHGTRRALELARAGDVLVLLAHIQRQEVLQLVHDFVR
ncbi:MAG TPA: cyanophycin synthetase, partial [Xanthomonadales bacterium]|nr:cyanophycin synthetase [Xanthomonadales bacterium]